ncbi:LysR family transcriptional regulator [Streptomyces sp. WG5]|uniref:LysR family transcriptional regulator n=1 Tax=Streptomyces sp. WG5 TaxID=3417648 RepID=UPI003CF06E1C
MDVRQLEYVPAAGDSGGSNRAAPAVHGSQSSLSRRGRTLERSLGSELLHRIGRSAVFAEDVRSHGRFDTVGRRRSLPVPSR